MIARYRAAIYLALLVIGTGTSTACALSGSGGIAAVVVTALLVAIGAFVAVAQTGCSDDPEENQNNYTNIGPCLSPPMPDAYNDGQEDTGTEDAGTEDTGSDADADGDTGEDGDADTGGDESLDIGPCLSPPPPDAYEGDDDAGSDDADGDAMGMTGERDQILAKMRDRLPDDIVARLDHDDGKG